MDYDELTLNPLLTENEAETSTGDPEGEKKSRRYWTPKEEDRFYEIWGRENWRLTRYGKNTIFFAQWSGELEERWNIDVKPEEVQAKVNQTKAKYRQVVKHMELEKSNITKWKKFDVIDKILRNEYRPKDAEPIPAEALEKSREFSPLQPQTMGSSTDKSQSSESLATSVDQIKQENNQNSLDLTATEALGVNTNDLEPLSNSVIFNNSDSQRSTSQFNTELFTDPIDEIKQEEFNDEFDRYDVQNSNLYNQTQPQLTQLQTPQQQHQQQQQQQEQYQEQQYQAQPQMQTSTMHSQQQLQQHMQQQQQQQQQQQEQQQLQQQQQQQEQQQQRQLQQQQIQTHFDQSLNSFAVAASPSNPRSLLVNNQNHFNNLTSTPPIRHQTQAEPASNPYVNNYGANAVPAATETLPQATTTTTNNNSSNNGSSSTNSMQPPRINAFVNAPVVQTRKRRTSMQVALDNAAAAAALAKATSNDSLEHLYLEEVRKKNLILDEQKEISRKRLLLEERKIALMEQFFPKCLELQEQILQKLNSA